MPDATFSHSNPRMIDYTPSADVAAGEIVLLGNTTGLTCGVAHVAIENGVLGSLAVGGGVYDIEVADNYAAYSTVYWDGTQANTTSTNNALFGYTVETSPAANSVVKVLHHPYV